MTYVNGYSYTDLEGREIFHVPLVFVVVDPPNGPIEIIFEPRKLKSRLRGLRRVVANGIRDVEIVGVHESDVKMVIDLCFSSRISRGRDYCERLFYRMGDELSAYYRAISKGEDMVQDP